MQKVARTYPQQQQYRQITSQPHYTDERDLDTTLDAWQRQPLLCGQFCAIQPNHAEDQSCG
jgi:hypothetical protein